VAIIKEEYDDGIITGIVILPGVEALYSPDG